MNSRTVTFLLALSMLIPNSAITQDSGSVFEEYDLDGDDVIDRIEFGMSAVAQKAREEGREEIIGERFNRLDLDQDNAVSREEFHRAVPEPEDDGFALSDRNEDGMLNEVEYLQATGTDGKLREYEIPFREADRDRDGLLSRDEWNVATAAKTDTPERGNEGVLFRELFEDADRDRDDRLTESEFGRSDFGKRIRERGGRDMVEVIFARLDTNRDVFLSLEEFSALPGQPGRPGRMVGKGKGKGKGKGARGR